MVLLLWGIWLPVVHVGGLFGQNHVVLCAAHAGFRCAASRTPNGVTLPLLLLQLLLQGVALRCLPCGALLLNAQAYKLHLQSKVRELLHSTPASSRHHTCQHPRTVQLSSIEAPRHAFLCWERVSAMMQQSKVGLQRLCLKEISGCWMSCNITGILCTCLPSVVCFSVLRYAVWCHAMLSCAVLCCRSTVAT